jgi:hypothetical protein
MEPITESQSPNITSSQREALRYVREYAVTHVDAARQRIEAILSRHHAIFAPYFKNRDPNGSNRVSQLLNDFGRHCRVVVHFHPDRFAADGRTVMQSLLEHGIYRSQFETRISNGGLTAFPGGDRDQWEKRLFGGAYHSGSLVESERPKYGALDFLGFDDGAAPRFGSCHFVLKPEVLSRCTFSFRDSYLQPDDLCTSDTFEGVVAPLLEALEQNKFAHVSLSMFVDSLVSQRGSMSVPGRLLDDYIEAQIHGDILLARDVELLAADPSFNGVDAGDHMTAAASRFGFPIRWSSGFRLSFDSVPSDFRGQAMPILAAYLRDVFHPSINPSTECDALTVALIGAAARAIVSNTTAWQDRGSTVELLQQLKQLWHVLVHCGHPLRSPVTIRSV